MVAYLSTEDVTNFLNSSFEQLVGCYYEWEGEDVVHIHSHPILHAFGKTGTCIFSKKAVENVILEEDVRFVVINNECKDPEKSKLYLVENGKVNQIPLLFIPNRSNLYSRSKGLLEIGVLSRKHVAIVGLGSFGSQIAIELAKAGVGIFSLFDFDRIELHNLGRHTCTIKDLGRLKTNAIEEAILGKNPYATINKYPIDISKNKAEFDAIAKNVDLVICATDNNTSRYIISEILCKYEKVGIFGRAITRAAGGDVFRYRPGGPCYSCLIGSQFINANDEEISSEEAGRRSGVIPEYASSSDIDAMVQVGLSIDIEPICNLMLKLALVELSRGENSGISSLEDDLKYDAYVWANRRDRNFSNWTPFYQSGRKQTILKWYGINIEKDNNCPICSEKLRLDLGREFPGVSPEDFEGLEINLD